MDDSFTDDLTSDHIDAYDQRRRQLSFDVGGRNPDSSSLKLV